MSYYLTNWTFPSFTHVVIISGRLQRRPRLTASAAGDATFPGSASLRYWASCWRLCPFLCFAVLLLCCVCRENCRQFFCCICRLKTDECTEKATANDRKSPETERGVIFLCTVCFSTAFLAVKVYSSRQKFTAVRTVVRVHNCRNNCIVLRDTRKGLSLTFVQQKTPEMWPSFGQILLCCMLVSGV